METLTRARLTVQRAALNFIFPPQCAACDDPLTSADPHLVCRGCYDALVPCLLPVQRPAEEKACAFTRHFAAFEFDDRLKRIIHFLKYDHKRTVGERLGQLLYARVPVSFLENVDGIVPVPVHPTRWRERGYNQAEVIAGVVAGGAGIPLMTDALRRVRSTRTQTKLKKTERIDNIEAAFQARERLDGRTLIVFDDIYTTGSTSDACTRALLGAGAKEVRVMTVARVV
ncbi:MAG: ComF family protein [Fibrobacterota bacterium]